VVIGTVGNDKGQHKICWLRAGSVRLGEVEIGSHTFIVCFPLAVMWTSSSMNSEMCLSPPRSHCDALGAQRSRSCAVTAVVVRLTWSKVM